MPSRRAPAPPACRRGAGLCLGLVAGWLPLACVSPRHYYSGGGSASLVIPSPARPASPADVPADSAPGPPPARLAVAEVGETSPPGPVMAALRRRPHPFTSVVATSGRPARDSGAAPPGGVSIADLVEAARRAGADHLLLLSAHAETGTPDAVRGVPPERQRHAPLRLSQWTRGRAAAALFRVRDAAVVDSTAATGLRKDPAVLPGMRSWFYGSPSALLARSMMAKAARHAQLAASKRARAGDREVPN